MRFLIVALSILLAACGTEAVDPEPTAVSSDEVVVPRVESEAATFRVVRVMNNLENPWGMTWLPDGRMLITERPGRLNLVEGETVTAVSGLPEIQARGQGGLMDVALHPEYERTGWIYFTYTAPGDDGNGTVLARGKLDGTAMTSIETLYEQTPFVDSGRHFGSRIVFANDGTLFFGIGDRGQRDPALDTENSIGNIFRLNLDGSIPDDNPFVGQDGYRPEIFAYGVRNPQGMALHPQTGQLWEHEHGPHGGDEINLIEAGNNYGWPAITYGDEYSDQSPIGGTEAPGMEQPVTYWDPSIAPSGMAFYTGDQFPGWENQMFVGALAHQHIRRVVLDGNEVVQQEELLRDEIGRIRDVRMGPDGYLYALTDASDGALYRLEPVE
ncbi:MAG: PQQ-dependent sugar dehydrogenase [Bacteroidetes bacterium]|jgi:glucose/arabinose dehydrogenase|nr:PQQ-dependent sugar dehydrogenase [Bacteroidota bacterium]